MWLIDSSIGRKVVMSVTGAALILFLTFHMAMNCVALISGDAYNVICEFLGANWYAQVGTYGLAILMALHFVYAFILTIQNRRARGSERYAVTERPKSVEWASQNMLVLGVIVLVGLLTERSYRWRFPDPVHVLTMVLRNYLYNLACRSLVPSFTRILEHVPDCRLEWHQMAAPLAGYRKHLRYTGNPGLPKRGLCLLFQETLLNRKSI